MSPDFSSLADARAWFAAWLMDDALPLWAAAGRDAARGSFQEALTVAGEPWPAPRRARVQARQIWVYATAAAAGLGRAYREAAERAYGFYRMHYLGADGLFCRAAQADGGVSDPTAALYEQAFSLLAMAALGAAEDARVLRSAMAPLRHAAGGYRETGERPFQANAHMHLLEAALAWE